MFLPVNSRTVIGLLISRDVSGCEESNSDWLVELVNQFSRVSRW